MANVQILSFLFCIQASLASVDLEVSIIQYSNPSGTSYHGMNYTGGRKCCDTGAAGTDCRQSTDTCDIFFAFCIGILEPSGCNGSYIDMREDVSHDTNHINMTSKGFMRMSSMSWWDKDLVNLTANVFDIDGINKTTGSLDTELVDYFSQTLNITPSPYVLGSIQHTVLLLNKVSLGITVRVWCTPGWHGSACEQQCNSSNHNSFHDCSKNGTLKTIDRCSSKDLLVMSLNTTLLNMFPLFSFQRKLVEFIATNVCPWQMLKTVNVQLQNIRYKRPSDSPIGVEFYAFCNLIQVSRLKFIQTIYILNKYPLYQEYPTNIFNVPVLSPNVAEAGPHLNQTSIYFLVRIVRYENKGAHHCQLGNVDQTCNPVMRMCFHKSVCETISIYNATKLTDCNGHLVNLDGYDNSSANASSSTILFSLSSFQGNMIVTIYEEKIGEVELASYNVSFKNLVVDSYFSGSFPYTYLNTVKNVTLEMEIMSWCGKSNFGAECRMKKPDAFVGSFRAKCSSNTQCQNNGFCRDSVCICSSGWTGPACSVDIDECALSPCINSLGCENTPGSFQCNCTEGFHGQNCDQDEDECKTSPCHNSSTCLNTYGGYKCLCARYWKGPHCNVSDFCAQNICEHSTSCSESNGDFKCTCIAGWTGKKCDQDINECSHNICSNTSSLGCINTLGSYTCRCKPGFEGASCEHYNECKVFRPCQNGGRCHNVPGGHFCNCQPAWTGKNCTEPVDTCQEDPCHNNGTCLEVRGGGFQCNCQHGWTGKFCVQNIDECTTYGRRKLCYSHGNCLDTQGSFTCVCDKGWTGQLCKTDISECASNPCHNNGTCTNFLGGFRCDCSRGWSGDTCQNDVDECDTLTPCQNNGTCLNLNGSYECVCTDAWDGQNCTSDIDECQLSPSVCANNGTCQNTVGGFNCSCLSGWQGDKCSKDIDECSSSNPCKNSGTCINYDGGYSCNCTSAWKGPNCTENINECEAYLGVCGHGMCIDTQGEYNCSCFLGWQGKNCLNDIDECQNLNSCSNYSMCINTLGAYHCQCVDGWTGFKCDTNINECLSNPCKNGGTCLDKTAYYKCICPNGWNGLNCQTDINECLHSPCTAGQICENRPGHYVCTMLNTTISALTKVPSTPMPNTKRSTISSSTIGTTSTSTSLSTSLSTVTTSIPLSVVSSTTMPNTRRSTISSSTIGTTSTSMSSSTSLSTVTTSIPLSVDVFSLQFASPVTDKDLPSVRKGIYNILKLLNCHDSSHIYVSLVNNSISNPSTVEFHAQCDGHHLTNGEINTAIRTLSKETLLKYFPEPLKQLTTTSKSQLWISSHTAVVGGAAAGGLLVVIVIIISCVVYRKRQARKYQKGEQTFPQETFVQEERNYDMDGSECVMIANPTYDSLYQQQTQA